MEVDQANDDDDLTSISPRSSVDESQGYKYVFQVLTTLISFEFESI